MNVPGDVLYGDVLVRLSGNREAIIEITKESYYTLRKKLLLRAKSLLCVFVVNICTYSIFPAVT